MHKSKEQIDTEILDFLKEKSKATLQEIAEKVGEKHKRIRFRLKQLKRAGKLHQQNKDQQKLFVYGKYQGPPRSEFQKNIILLCITLIVMLAVSEVIVRFYYLSTDRTLGVDEEEVCDRRAYQLSIGKEISTGRHQIGFPPYYEYSPYSGIWPQKNVNMDSVQDVTLGDGQPAKLVIPNVRTNEQRLRSLENIDIEKTPGRKRIAIFGDSFTWGADVSLQFSYPSLLQRLIPGSEVMNYGIEGTGIDVMYMRWKYESLDYNPDVVIWGIFVDDIRRAFPCIHKPKFKRVGDELKISNFPPPTYPTIRDHVKEPAVESYLVKHLLYNLHYLGGVPERQYKEGFEILDLMLDEVQETSKEKGQEFMVLIIDGGNRREGETTPLTIASTAQLREMLEEKGIEYVGSDDIFAAENFTPSDYAQEAWGHFAPDGYAYLAQGLKNRLESLGIVEKQKDFYFTIHIDKNILGMEDKETGEVENLIPYDITLEES